MVNKYGYVCIVDEIIRKKNNKFKVSNKIIIKKKQQNSPLYQKNIKFQEEFSF